MSPTSISPLVRVACITFDGTTLTVPAAELSQHIDALDDSQADIEGDELTYTLTFKTITQAQLDALGEFDGF